MTLTALLFGIGFMLVVSLCARNVLRVRLRYKHCAACRYDRQGLPRDVPCPECGRRPPTTRAELLSVLFRPRVLFVGLGAFTVFLAVAGGSLDRRLLHTVPSEIVVWACRMGNDQAWNELRHRLRDQQLLTIEGHSLAAASIGRLRGESVPTGDVAASYVLGWVLAHDSTACRAVAESYQLDGIPISGDQYGELLEGLCTATASPADQMCIALQLLRTCDRTDIDKALDELYRYVQDTPSMRFADVIDVLQPCVGGHERRMASLFTWSKGMDAAWRGQGLAALVCEAPYVLLVLPDEDVQGMAGAIDTAIFIELLSQLALFPNKYATDATAELAMCGIASDSHVVRRRAYILFARRRDVFVKARGELVALERERANWAGTVESLDHFGTSPGRPRSVAVPRWITEQ